MTDATAPSNYLNRELSWLEFNQRVLAEACDASVPLLERVKFLAITASNLDEYFMVRVGSLQMLLAQGSTVPDPSGMTPERQLQAISARTHRMTVEQYQCFLETLEPQLAEAGIRRVRREALHPRQSKLLEQLFDDEIASVLTPMAVTSSDNFPLLINQSMNVCVQLAPAMDDPKKKPRFAIVPFGRSTSRFVTLPSDGGYEFMLLEDVIGIFVERFFPGETIRECVPFRITRNADFSVREDLAPDLLAEMEEVIEAGAPPPASGWRFRIVSRRTC